MEHFKSWLTSNGKMVSLLVTMLIGMCIPQAHLFTFLVQYLLMVMLFFSFIDLQIDRSSFQTGAVKVLGANLVIGFGCFFLCMLINRELAATAFITAIAPTAISSTVIVGFIRGRVDFMIAAVLLTNIVVALIVPFAIPYVVGSDLKVSTINVLVPVLITMFVPLILARLTIFLPIRVKSMFRSGKRFIFPIWLLNLFIISAKASHFIFIEGSASFADLLKVAGLALVICVINFVIGAILGGREYWQESSQALGQKNNSFAIWIALTYISPIAVMGPMIYTLYHHLYNTWQIYLYEKKENLWKKQISA